MKGELTEYLLGRVLSLRPAVRAELQAKIAASLVPDVPAEVRLGLLADRLAAVSGIDVREHRSANRVGCMARTVFVYVARQAGFTTTQIGRFVGRDHSTVVVASARMQDALDCPAADRELVELYRRYMNQQ